MADQRAQYTEEAVGANHPTKVDVINRLILVDHNNDGTHEKLDVGSDADGDIYYRASPGVLTRLPKGTARQLLKMNIGATAPEWGTPFDYVKVSDVKADGADGGGFTQGAWRTRDINTEDSDDAGICSIAANQITLEAGKYICSISCPSYSVRENFAQLYNISDASMTLMGTCNYTNELGSVGGVVFISGPFTIAAQKIFEVQHYCIRTLAGTGFGIGGGVGGINSVFTVAEFWRIT